MQFFDYIGSLVQGDLGTSLIDGRDIGADLADRLPVTASIALFATLLSGMIGVFLGVTAAVRGGRFGKFITSPSGVALSLPAFWVGMLLVYLLSIQLELLPATGYVAFSDDPVGWFQSLLLPVLTLTVGGAAIIARTAAAGMREALRQEHIRTLRAVGTPRLADPLHARPAVRQRAGGLGAGHPVHRAVRRLGHHREPLRHAGSRPGEPGRGVSHDFPALIGVVVVATIVVVFVNLLLDLVIAWLDPKVRTA